MKPIALEIIMRDSTRQGMQSVTGNMSVLEKCIQNNTLMLRQLEKALKDMQTQFSGSTKTVADQSENIAMMEALKKEVAELKAKLIELEKVKKMPPKNIPIELMPEINTPQFYKQVQLMVKQLESDIAKAQVKASITIDGAVQQNEIAKIKTMSEELEKMNGILQKMEIQKRNTNEVPVVAPNAGKAAAMQFNGLGMSIQQVARELPSLTMGANMFFLAISNNLPILADNIKQARTEYDLLKKSNQAATPVWKQVVSSIFSWQTAMVVGITLLTLYGKEIGEWTKSLFKSKDATKALLSAEQEMALARKKSISDSTKERAELDLLYSKLKSTTTSTKERNAAVSEWTKRYPQHSNIMNGELVSLGKLSSAYQSLSKQIIETAKARAYSDNITELEIKRYDSNFKRLNQQNTLKITEEEYLKTKEVYDKLQKEYDKGKSVGQALSVARVPYMNAKEEYEKQKKIYDGLEKQTNDYVSKIGHLAEQIKVDDLFPQAKEGTYDYWQQQVQIADTALKQIASKQKKILDNAAKEPKKDLYALGIDKSIVDSYKSAVKAKKEAEKELEAYPSSSESTKQENQADKLREQQEKLKLLTDKQALEQSRSEQDLQNQVDQARIDAMKDGSVKTLVQMQLSHKKEMQQFEREKEDKLRKAIEDARTIFDAEEDAKKAQNPKYTKKTFEASGVKLADSDMQKYGEQENFIGKKQKRETEEYYKSLRDSYQDYTDKRIAIEEKFNTDIATLQEARKKYEQAGDTEKVDQMNRAIAQATTNKGKELMGVDYEQLKQTPEYVRAFENLRETSSDTLSSLLSQFENAKQTAAEVLSPDELREYTTTIQEIMDELDSRNPFGALADRKKELAEAEAELAKAQQQLIAVQDGAQIVTGVKSTKLNKSTGKIESEKTYLTATKAMENYNKAQDNVAKKGAKVEKAEREVDDVVSELSQSISDVGAAIGGPAGEIISLIGDIGSFTMTAMSGVETASQTASTAIQKVEKASAILAIIGAAIQVAMKIASLFKGDDEEEQRKKYIDHLNEIINIYDKIIDKQKESIKFGYGFAAIESARKAMQELNKQTEEYRKVSKASSTFLLRNRSKEYIQAMKEVGVEIREHSSGLATTGELSNLSSKQLEYIRNNYKDLWASLGDEQRNALQAIIDAESESKEIIDAWKESITGISYDSFYDGFIDTLSDMDMSAADMAENFGEYLRKSILAAMVAKNFQKDIDGLYDKWAAAADEKSDGGFDITDSEAKAIQDEYKKLADAMVKKREEMEKLYGWESEADKTTQSGKAGAITTITQDQGTKLEGLFTVLQIHTKDIDDTVTEIHQAMYKAADMLAQIVANTAYCRHLEQMSADIAELKRDGIKLK